MDLLYSIFTPEIIHYDDSTINNTFDNIKIKDYYDTYLSNYYDDIIINVKFNLIITITKTEINFYKIYQSNINVVNNIANIVKYPTYSVDGIIDENFMHIFEENELYNIFCEKSNKGGIDNDELREIINTEKFIQFLLNFISQKKILNCGYYHKTHKNNVLWNKTKNPWRRNFHWLGFKCLLKKYKTKYEYQQIISKIMIDILNDYMKNTNLLETSILNRLLLKLNKKISKHSETFEIINPFLLKIEQSRIKKNISCIIDDIITNVVISNNMNIVEKKFYYNDTVSVNLLKKKYFPRDKQLYKFEFDFDFDYYFDNEELNISRKILYCANYLKLVHSELKLKYPELERIKFDFNHHIFSHLLLRTKEDVELLLKVKKYFNNYKIGINIYDELSLSLGKRLYKNDIEKYRTDEETTIELYKNKMKYLEEYIMNCETEINKYKCDCKCRCYCTEPNKKKYKEYCTTIKNEKDKIIALEKCLPENDEKAYIIYTELNYPNDLFEFRNYYYKFLTLFYEEEQFNDNIYFYSSCYGRLITNFQEYNYWFRLKTNIRNNGFIMISTTKPFIISHYKNENKVVNLSMGYDYAYRDGGCKKINFDKIKLPKFNLNKKLLDKFLEPRESDNLVYTDLQSELTHLTHIKFGELMVGNKIRFMNLASILSENVVNFNDTDVLKLIKTNIWLSDVFIENNKYNNIIKNTEEIIEQVNYHLNLIKDNCEKIIHMEMLIHILNRILLENKNCPKSIKILNDINKIIDNWWLEYEKNNNVKILLQLSNLYIQTNLWKKNLLTLLIKSNYVFENKINTLDDFSLDSKQILYSCKKYTNEDLTKFLSLKINKNIDENIKFVENGSDYYCYYQDNLFEINPQTGEFYINNAPLNTLPFYILNNDDYKRIYGTKNMKTYVDATGKYINETDKISITCIDKKNILIEQEINKVIYRYIPNKIFYDLSSDLQNKYHWKNMNSGMIEFRDDLGKLYCKLDNGIITNLNNEKYHSILLQEHWKHIFLNLSKNINIWNNRIEFYTLKLNFILDEKQKIFVNYDTKNKILLNVNLIKNIPNKIICENNLIYINEEEKLYIYEYIENLDYIKAVNNSIEDWLILAYTYGFNYYHCEAWDVLNTQCFNTENFITENELKILEKIESLSPCRTFYPSHLQTMEQVNDYSKLFDGYILWVYKYKNYSLDDFQIVKDLTLNMRSYILNRELYPFSKDLDCVYNFNVKIYKLKNYLKTSQIISAYNILEFKHVNINGNNKYCEFINLLFKSYTKLDIIKLVYKYDFDDEIIFLMTQLPNKKCELRRYNYYFTIDSKKYLKNNCSFKDSELLCSCKSYKCHYCRCVDEFNENLKFVDYVCKLTINYELYNIIENPPYINNLCEPYNYEKINYVDDSRIGLIRNETIINQQYGLEMITGLKLREKQINVTTHLLNNHKNITTQLNMGEGKTTMILPLIILNLIYKKQKRPIIILKNTLYQMHSSELRHKLGLLGIKCFHMKCSRDVKINENQIKKINEINNLVIMMTAEEKKSFELKMKDNFNQVYYDFINSNTHIIIDESDDILHPRNQLIWVYGNNVPLENASLRYKIPKLILDFCHIKKCVDDEYLINDEYIDNREIAKYIINGYCRNKKTEIEKEQMLNYTLDTSNINYLLNDTEMKDFCNVLKLYLNFELLENCLNMRYRVNYGIDKNRKSKLAVPYLYKDVPTQKSEFGHIDKTIFLTYICWYLNGMEIQDLIDFFPKLSKTKYETFNINYPFESINSYTINMNFKLFNKNKQLINYWLESFVFPKYINQYPLKRCANPYNLIKKEEENINNTIGFSGTNGTQILQPSTIIQKDLCENLNTNKNIDDLIKKQKYVGYENFKSLDTLFRNSIFNEINVIIDTGSLIMEQNEEFSKKWLKTRTDKKNVICFNMQNERICIDKFGNNELFEKSIAFNNLSKCLIYIDQSHSIGTHFDFPEHFKALVTIGKNVSRDKLAQGCMRMRKIASTHKIYFITNEKIAKNINDSNDILKMCKNYSQVEINKMLPIQKTHELNYNNDMPLINENISLNEMLQKDIIYEPETQNELNVEQKNKLNTEQEKELEKEIEEERNIERQYILNARKHMKYEYIDDIIFGINIFNSHKYNFEESHVEGIYYSYDWKTIEYDNYKNYNCHERIPKWIIQINKKILAVSQFEANLLYQKTNKLKMFNTIYSKNQFDLNKSHSSKINLFYNNLYFNSKKDISQYLKLIKKYKIEYIDIQKNVDIRKNIEYYQDSELDKIFM